jgi:hypothetical protein
LHGNADTFAADLCSYAEHAVDYQCISVQERVDCGLCDDILMVEVFNPGVDHPLSIKGEAISA